MARAQKTRRDLQHLAENRQPGAGREATGPLPL